MNELKRYIQPHLLALQAYSSARADFQGSANIWLDANESPYENGQNRYPDDKQNELRKAWATLRNVEAVNVLATSGSDEGIDLLIRATCQGGRDKIAICPPTYGVYGVAAKIQNVGIENIPLLEGKFLDNERIAKSSARLLFLTNPNNPTGETLALEAIENAAQNFRATLVVDEAYIDFGGQSAISLIKNYPNIVVLQTMSKAWGLASARVGFFLASKSWIELLDKIKPVYNISTHSAKMALQQLRNRHQVERQIEKVIQQRKRMVKSCKQLGFSIPFDSKANFFLLKTENHEALYDHLAQKGIVVRNRSAQMKNTLRISIGLPAENDRLLGELASFVNGKWPEKREVEEYCQEDSHKIRRKDAFSSGDSHTVRSEGAPHRRDVPTADTKEKNTPSINKKTTTPCPNEKSYS